MSPTVPADYASREGLAEGGARRRDAVRARLPMRVGGPARPNRRIGLRYQCFKRDAGMRGLGIGGGGIGACRAGHVAVACGVPAGAALMSAV
jgi:hypothetical protein